MTTTPHNVLLITKGHPFERDAFFALFDALDGIDWTHVEQPAAQAFFTPEMAAPYDAFVLYDMPGLAFAPGRSPDYVAPDPAYVDGFLALLDAGHGFVFLHHALAGWPAWDAYGDIVGGRFLYRPGEVRGSPCPDSGYRHDVTHEVRVVDPDHPVVAGLPPAFMLTDELYLAEVFEDDVVPLLTSTHDFVAGNFYSADHAVRLGRMYSNQGWHHPPGSNLIGWAKSYGNSPIVYLQPGDAPAAYANPDYRRLIANAVGWVASAEARAWARERTGR